MAHKKQFVDVDEVIRKLESEKAEIGPILDTDGPITKLKKRLIPKLLQDVIDYLKDQPTVDAVEVVRCENCEQHAGCILEDIMYGIDPEKDRFCSCGKRREDNAVN